MTTERMTDEQMDTLVQTLEDDAAEHKEFFPSDKSYQNMHRGAIQTITQLRNERDHWKKEYRDWEEREAAVCPEDFSFEEVITQLRTDLAAANERAEKLDVQTSQRDGLINELTTKLCDANERADKAIRSHQASLDESHGWIDTLAAPDLYEALGALGAMPDGYCFCSRDRDPSKETHEPECRNANAALAKADAMKGGSND